MNACAVELGLGSPAHRQPRMEIDARPAEDTCDLTYADCEAMTAFVAALPQPIRPEHKDERSHEYLGERVFEQIGYAVCHVRDLGPVRGIYSDLLLHQVGKQLSSPVYYGSFGIGDRDGTPPVLPNEWRTPPLWGCADSAPYMHDGRCATLANAILEHHEQAATSVSRYERLSTGDKKLLRTVLTVAACPQAARSNAQEYVEKLISK